MRILGEEVSYKSNDDLIFGRNFHKIIAFCIFPVLFCYGIGCIFLFSFSDPSYVPIRTVALIVFLFLLLPYLYCTIKARGAYLEIKRRQIVPAAKARYSKARKIVLWIYIIFVGLVTVLTLIATSDSRSSSSSNKKETGYWGSDGYYNPSDDEMDEVWDDVHDWMEDNW